MLSQELKDLKTFAKYDMAAANRLNHFISPKTKKHPYYNLFSLSRLFSSACGSFGEEYLIGEEEFNLLLSLELRRGRF